MTSEKLEKIKNFVFENMNDAYHDFAHLDRVRNNALRFADILGLSEKIDLNLLQAICYLHDAAYFKHKNRIYTYIFERSLVKKELENILLKFDVDKEESEIIIKACSSHTHSFPFKRLNKNNDLYTRLLQDADTVDLFHQERLSITKKPFLEKYFSTLIDKVKYLGIKNIRKYLNFPELYEEAYKQYISS